MLDGVDDTSPANKINSVTFFSQLLFVSIFLSVSHMTYFCFMYLFTNILFFPTQLSNLRSLIIGQRPSPKLSMFTSLISLLHALANPVLYGWMSQRYRNAYKFVFKMMLCACGGRRPSRRCLSKCSSVIFYSYGIQTAKQSLCTLPTSERRGRGAPARDWRKGREEKRSSAPRISHQSPPAHPRRSLVGREKRDCFAVYTASGYKHFQHFGPYATMAAAICSLNKQMNPVTRKSMSKLAISVLACFIFLWRMNNQLFHQYSIFLNFF